MWYKRLEMYVWWTCNQKCTYCMEFSNMEKTWTKKVTEYEVLKKLLKYKKLWYNHVTYLWWEPFIQWVFLYALKVWKKLWYTILVTTNCTTLHIDKQAKKYLPYIDELIISVEAIDKWLQQKISRSKVLVYWDNVFKNINKYWKWSYFKANIVITKDNLLDIFNIVKYNFKYCGISEIYRFIKSKDSIAYLLPSLIAGVMNGMALVLIYSAYGRSVSDSFLLGYAGYIMLLRSVILFLNTALNKLYFLKFSNEYFQKDSGSIGDGVMALLVKNILSIVLSGCMVFAAYHFFYEEYFSKYDGVQNTIYALFGLWLVFEVVYLTLYQKIQVYGLMWESLIAITLPTFVYALIVNRLEMVYSLESLLLVYISIMSFSILIVMYISNKKEKELVL